METYGAYIITFLIVVIVALAFAVGVYHKKLNESVDTGFRAGKAAADATLKLLDKREEVSKLKKSLKKTEDDLDEAKKMAEELNGQKEEALRQNRYILSKITPVAEDAIHATNLLTKYGLNFHMKKDREVALNARELLVESVFSLLKLTGNHNMPYLTPMDANLLRKKSDETVCVSYMVGGLGKDEFTVCRDALGENVHEFSTGDWFMNNYLGDAVAPAIVKTGVVVPLATTTTGAKVETHDLVSVNVACLHMKVSYDNGTEETLLICIDQTFAKNGTASSTGTLEGIYELEEAGLEATYKVDGTVDLQNKTFTYEASVEVNGPVKVEVLGAIIDGKVKFK